EILVEELARLGATVERSTSLTGFDQDGSRVLASLRGPGGAEAVEADYLVGCDGAHSEVRRGMGLAFPGGTYSQVFFVADVEAKQDRANAVQVSVSREDFCILM